MWGEKLDAWFLVKGSIKQEIGTSPKDKAELLQAPKSKTLASDRSLHNYSI